MSNVKRYTANIETLGGVDCISFETSDNCKGEWVKWEDVKEMVEHNTTATEIDLRNELLARSASLKEMRVRTSKELEKFRRDLEEYLKPITKENQNANTQKESSEEDTQAKEQD